jgi:hypothetical protein
LRADKLVVDAVVADADAVVLVEETKRLVAMDVDLDVDSGRKDRTESI